MEQSPIAFVILGVITGILAGIFGVGGGIIIVPALIWGFHMTQHQAQGMSLAALLLPVGLLGFIAYRQEHAISIKFALLIALGMFIGTYIGGTWAQYISPKHLKTAFGILLILSGCKMVFFR